MQVTGGQLGDEHEIKQKLLFLLIKTVEKTKRRELVTGGDTYQQALEDTTEKDSPWISKDLRNKAQVQDQEAVEMDNR